MAKVISEYDVIAVVLANPSVPEAEIGDIGAVLLVFGESASPEAYEVECVLPDGTNKWLGTFGPDQIKLICPGENANT